jgi:hypothetical protein
MFLIAFILHVAWWNVSRPADDLRALALCMATVPLFVAGAFLLLSPADTAGLALALVMAWAMGIAYLFWYPAAQAASPTMLITILAQRAGKNGISAAAIAKAIPDEVLTGETLQNLFHEKFATIQSQGKVHLGPRGRRTLFIIRILRRCAGLAEPKG